uniref:Uncharacterized protein n=1 Tax=Chromera velia CCMP2878 TaxID=1169474 RepID=A0A0G4GKV3_9ALVE|eukprot:Cvel_4850.t1-p1 / transcript=Cvel_4850.t1 / gene=Cvel_4850 / organism=Chromera_velia_CCMP2878 / gene_product=hypothetical protein / transcript_product=hypothetical protein / location=Cvel_scaffold218:110256-110477(-) / protein_length=74 / sequence_SO=supercontig / SO=protein_coding / is_pseudo=false
MTGISTSTSSPSPLQDAFSGSSSCLPSLSASGLAAPRTTLRFDFRGFSFVFPAEEKEKEGSRGGCTELERLVLV